MSNTVHALPGVSRAFVLRLVFLYLSVLSILGCAVYKAGTASMTHDESSTFLNLVDLDAVNLWKCHSDPACWTTANNHLLNTLLMRWSVAIWGAGELALRLPNLLLLLIYLLCVAGIVRDTVKTVIGALCGVAVLTLNPFVLDFFALARGYGMGLGWMMLSLFGAWRFATRRHQGYLALAFVAAALAVLSNLTYIAYAVALTGSLILYLLLQYVRSSGRVRIPGMLPVAMISCWAFLVWYFHKPIRILIELGEFDYGESSFWAAWQGFIRDSLYGLQWFGAHTVSIVSVSVCLLIFVLIILPWIRPADGSVKRFRRFLSLLCLMSVLFFFVNHEITGASYPSGRKAIMFYPPIALLCWFTLADILSRARRYQWLAGMIGIVLLLHIVRTYQPHTFREWWYDSTTREMIMYVAGKSRTGQHIRLDVEWIFHPTTHYYIQTRDLPVTLLPYTKEISPHRAADYFYLHPDQASPIGSRYVHEKTFNGRWLMHRAPDDVPAE